MLLKFRGKSLDCINIKVLMTIHTYKEGDDVEVTGRRYYTQKQTERREETAHNSPSLSPWTTWKQEDEDEESMKSVSARYFRNPLRRSHSS